MYSQLVKVLITPEDYCGKTGLKFMRLNVQIALADRHDIVAKQQTKEELFPAVDASGRGWARLDRSGQSGVL